MRVKGFFDYNTENILSKTPQPPTTNAANATHNQRPYNTSQGHAQHLHKPITLTDTIS